jgi:hypothetical protein
MISATGFLAMATPTSRVASGPESSQTRAIEERFVPEIFEGLTANL